MAFSVEHKRVVVMGAGRSGRAAAELLAARGADVVLADSNPAAQVNDVRGGRITLALGPHQPSLLTSADLVVLSPGVPPTDDAVAAAARAGVPVIGEVELASRWLTGRIIAVTGTKGKSTTTTLAARMLAEAGFRVTAGGNLGTALSTQVAASRPDALHVVEVSSFQLETIDTFHPWIAVLVNLSPDHLDRHASFDEYAAAKARIFRNQTADDWAVVNADDAASQALARGAHARRLDFGFDAPLDTGITVEDGQIVRRTGGVDAPLIPLSAVRLPGRHLVGDVLAAAAVGCIAGVPPPAMVRAVEGFRGLEHVLEDVGAIGGVRFINDSKATNVAAAKRAIQAFDADVVAIIGGRYKGGAFEALRELHPAPLAAVVAIGEAAPLVEQALAPAVPVEHAGSMAEAVRLAFARAAPEGVVLLAPGCSSFDMFPDYAARGRAFREEAARLMEEHGSGKKLKTEN